LRWKNLKKYQKFYKQWYKRDKGFNIKEEANKRAKDLWKMGHAVLVVFWAEIRLKKCKYDWYVYTKVYPSRIYVKRSDISVFKNKNNEFCKEINLFYI